MLIELSLAFCQTCLFGAERLVGGLFLPFVLFDEGFKLALFLLERRALSD